MKDTNTDSKNYFVSGGSHLAKTAHNNVKRANGSSVTYESSNSYKKRESNASKAPEKCA